MGQPAANAASLVQGVDTHIVLVPSPGGPVPTPLPHVFAGRFTAGLVPSVTIAGQPAVVDASMTVNAPAHLPTPPGVSFASPPTNQGAPQLGSASVFIGGQAAVRHGDPVRTCNDPADAPTSSVVSTVVTVVIG
jgi:uncharacterized Zn-binding protein involved in type VI secretion